MTVCRATSQVNIINKYAFVKIKNMFKLDCDKSEIVDSYHMWPVGLGV